MFKFLKSRKQQKDKLKFVIAKDRDDDLKQKYKSKHQNKTPSSK